MYQFDVGDVFSRPRLLKVGMTFLGRLAHEPRSMHRAMRLGGPEHYGWRAADHYLPTLGDLIQANTSVTAAHGGKRKPRKVKPLPRPEIKRQQATTLDQVNWSFFSA